MNRKRYRRISKEEAELDITAFMNLMIVLVPILLLGLVFSKITVVDVTLPA
jgi:biopolymer transport protein ExbD